MIDIRIIGNDIVLGGERVARIFDIRSTLAAQLEEAIDVAAGINLELDEIKDDSYEEGRKEGYREGYKEGLDEGYFKES